EDSPLMTRCAIAAFLIDGRKSILASIYIVQRAEEQLILCGPQQFQPKSAVREANRSQTGIGDFVTIVAVNALPRHTLKLSEIEVGRIAGSHAWRVASGANAKPVGILIAQAPTQPGFAVIVCASIETQEMPICGGGCMCACRPFEVHLPVTIAAMV